MSTIPTSTQGMAENIDFVVRVMGQFIFDDGVDYIRCGFPILQEAYVMI